MGTGQCRLSSWGNWSERDRWVVLGVDGWIILGYVCWDMAVYRVFVGKPEGKRPLGRPRRRWVDNIRMDLWGEGVYRVLVGNRRERDNWGDLGVDGLIILGCVCGERAVYKLLRKPEGNRPLGRPRRRCVDNIMLRFWGEGSV